MRASKFHPRNHANRTPLMAHLARGEGWAHIVALFAGACGHSRQAAVCGWGGGAKVEAIHLGFERLL